MAPRRSRRPRITRMDAAVDAMTPLGFSEALVKRVARELLTLYGGEEAWVLIEDGSYEVLRETLLRHGEENDQENNAQNENGTRNELNNEALAGASAVAEDFPQDTEISEYASVDASSAVALYSEGIRTSPGIDAGEENGRCWKDISLDQNSSHKQGSVGICDSRSRSSLPTSPLAIPSQTPVPKRRLPCYGWLESDDEDDKEFVYFAMQGESTPAVQRPRLSENISAVTNSMARRKSRWDEKPDDP